MRSATTLRAAVLLGALASLRCTTNGDTSSQQLDPPVQSAMELIRPEAIRAHLTFLADDALEGRGTGSRGHDLAVKYLRAQFQAFGLPGGAEGGEYFQMVPLRRAEVQSARTELRFTGNGQSRVLTYGTDYVLLDTHRARRGILSASVVFVGFGVTAPELDYDDYAGLDVKGKIVALLMWQAPPSFPSTVRAYYSAQDVKRANAAAHGAIAVLSVRSRSSEERCPASCVLRALRLGFNTLRWLHPSGEPQGLNDHIQAWAGLNRSGSEALFAGELHGLDDVLTAAEQGEPPRFRLSKTATIRFESRHTPVESSNVVSVLEGSDPVLKSEYVVYTAHVDHLGIGPSVDGDSIYNGAWDNAGGCAVLVEVARAFAALRKAPKRSVLFVAVTAEEGGLVGSDFFVHNPTLPSGRIVANLNIDGGATHESLQDVLAWGAEHSTLGTLAQNAAQSTGFEVSPDPFPEENMFLRSDHYSFVRRGIPALFLFPGVKSKVPGVDALANLKRRLATIYHSPRDDASQSFDYETSANIARFAFVLGHMIAIQPEPPTWNPGDFFGQKFGGLAH